MTSRQKQNPDLMKAYCTKCRINWANTWSEFHDATEEEYHFCPKCKNDFFLSDPVPGDQFMMTIGSGIINVSTGQQWQDPAISIKPFKERKPFDLEAYKIRKEQEDDIRDQALDAYTAAIGRGSSQQEAEQIYFTTLKQIKNEH